MNKDQRTAARLAAHHEQMKRYEADGYSRSEASERAMQDMRMGIARVDNGWTLTGSAALAAARAAPPERAAAERRDECFAAIDAMVAEIARLRAELVDARDQRDRLFAELHDVTDTHRRTIPVLSNAVAVGQRYRAALAEIVDSNTHQAVACRDIARRALDQG